MCPLKNNRESIRFTIFPFNRNVTRTLNPTEVLFVAQHSPGEAAETAGLEDDTAVAEGRPHGHRDDLANAHGQMKRQQRVRRRRHRRDTPRRSLDSAGSRRLVITCTVTPYKLS